MAERPDDLPRHRHAIRRPASASPQDHVHVRTRIADPRPRTGVSEAPVPESEPAQSMLPRFASCQERKWNSVAFVRDVPRTFRDVRTIPARRRCGATTPSGIWA